VGLAITVRALTENMIGEWVDMTVHEDTSVFVSLFFFFLLYKQTVG
jgi:hypothetical protein